jgi:methionyl-tRNA formyltransferase
MTCLIIGEGTLPVQCANLILNQGDTVAAVSSPDAPLAKWAAGRGIPQFRRLADMTGISLSNCQISLPVDCLFSVVNYRVVPARLLALARLAINYHDSLLPRYAGIRATSWALINGETTHGITWHVMAEGIDTGDILKQASFPVDARDTAYKLNLKCYYTAIAAFKELLVELKAGTVTRTKQDLSQRTYFSRSKRPDEDCLISFQRPAKRTVCLCRALDFESTPNVIGRPKVIVGGRLLMAPQVELAGVRSGAIPGTIVDIQENCARVATSTEDVIVPVFHTLGGRALPMTELSAYGLRVGVNIEASSLAEVSCAEQI